MARGALFLETDFCLEVGLSHNKLGSHWVRGVAGLLVQEPSTHEAQICSYLIGHLVGRPDDT